MHSTSFVGMKLNIIMRLL